MAIAVDIANEQASQSISPANSTSVGSVSASATAMIGVYVFNVSVAAMGTVTATWNAVAMTQIGAGVDIAGATNLSLWMFGLKSPASGTKVTSVSWTGGGNNQWYLGFATFTGSDTSGTGWSNATSGTGTGTTINAAVTTTSGDMAVAGMCNISGGIAVVAGTTSDWIEESLTPNGAEAHKAAVGASTTVAWTATSSNWGYIGVNVNQPGGAVAASWNDNSILRPKLWTY